MSSIPARAETADGDRSKTGPNSEAAKQPFAMVPKVISRDRSLSLGARVAWDLLTGYRWRQNTWCDVSMSVLADDLGVTANRARRFMHELELRALIRVERPPGRKIRVYFVDPSQTETPSRIDTPPKRRHGPPSLLGGVPSQTAPGYPSQTAPPNKEVSEKDKQDIIDNVDDAFSKRKREAEEALDHLGFTGGPAAVAEYGPELVLIAVALTNERRPDNPPGYTRDVLKNPGKYGIACSDGIWQRQKAEAHTQPLTPNQQRERLLEAMSGAITKFPDDVRTAANERWREMPGPERGELEDLVFAKFPAARDYSTIKRYAIYLELCKQIAGDTSELIVDMSPSKRGPNDPIPSTSATLLRSDEDKARAKEGNQGPPILLSTRHTSKDDSKPRTAAERSAADKAAQSALSGAGLADMVRFARMPPQRTMDERKQQQQAEAINKAFAEIARRGGDPSELQRLVLQERQQ